MKIHQEQFHGEAMFADLQREITFDNLTLALGCTEALNAWDRVEELGKRIEAFTKITQGLKEAFTDFWKRLTTAVNTVSDPEARQTFIEPLAFENAN